MKRFVSLFIIVCAVTVLTACGLRNTEVLSEAESGSEAAVESSLETETESCLGTEAESGSASESTSSDTHILVAYFSCTGTTEQVAQWIVKETGADSYEIVPEDPYTEEDLAYYTGGRADQEQEDDSARPAIAGSVENIEQYDVIFLGYPIWHGQAPRIISTFLESYDFSNVTIIPFCTSHSSDMGSSAEDLHSLCADTVTWLEGQRFSGDATEDDVVEWVEGL